MWLGCRGVSLGVGAIPIPGAADNFFEVGALRLPVEFAFDFFGAGYQDSGVAGAALDFADGDGVAGDAAGGFDDFAYAEAFSVAEIVDELVFFLQRVENEEVSARKIANMNVIAHAGAVGSRIVGAEDGDGLALA